MKDPVRINNVVFDRSRVLWVACDQTKQFKVVARFEDGRDIEFEGPEAIIVWELFDKEKTENSS